MKCQCNKLHYAKYLKENLEHEIEQREQIIAGYLYGGSGENERGSNDVPGRGAVLAHRLRGAQGMGGAWEDAAGERSAVPAHAVREDHPAGNPEGNAGAAGSTESRSGSGEAGDSERIRGTEETGWEPEREYFYLHVRGAHQRRERNQRRVRNTADEKKPAYVDHDLGIGGAVGAGIRAVSALGRLTEEDDSDDPEEQKRKHEAQQAADNVGAVLGLAIGAIEAFTQNNQSLNRIPDEEQQIEEEEEFNEFLARMDEEYEYKEQQRTM